MEGKETEKHLPGDLKITWHLFRSPSERFHFTKLRCIHFGIGFQISRLDCFLWLHFFCCKRISTELLRNVLHAVTCSYFATILSPVRCLKDSNSRAVIDTSKSYLTVAPNVEIGWDIEGICINLLDNNLDFS